MKPVVEPGRFPCDWKRHAWEATDNTQSVFYCVRCGARMTIPVADLPANGVKPKRKHRHRRGPAGAGRTDGMRGTR